MPYSVGSGFAPGYMNRPPSWTTFVNREKKREIGWREEAHIILNKSYANIFTNHKAVKQSKKLTDHGWNIIKDELVQLLSVHKTQCLADKHRVMHQECYSCLKQEYARILAMSDLRVEPFPLLGDILTNKVFEDYIWNTPDDEDLSKEFCASQLSEHLPSILDEWRSAKTKELIEIMQKVCPEATAADLNLLTTLFGCKGCGSTIHFPQMFYHRCCVSNNAPV
ncbi:hypothetical protein BDP27DRAFT_1429767 [Rhodocollybia butyracea]|uniref:Uncharacterized protein n=1 Tax=Rhodocollybia butyracea TaxID=206335 RepID=A0A9P5P9D5_9AGAR|nr:hypothetical protein BDP27DRAFT_1429767 [Rhodocollybia butyracea]